MIDDKQYLLERLELAETATLKLAEIILAFLPNLAPYLQNWNKTWDELLNELDRRYEK